MDPLLRSEAVLTAALAAAAIASFWAAALCWAGSPDLTFGALALSGSAMTVMAFWSLSQLVRTRESARFVRTPLLTVTKDVFKREPPIRGKSH